MIKAPVSAVSHVITVRPAKSEDVPLIFENIGYWAGQGKMLVRPMQNIFENLRDFFVAEIETQRCSAHFVGRHRRGAWLSGTS